MSPGNPQGNDGPVLAGDIGGTKTLLALFDAGGARVTEQRFSSSGYANLETMAREFLDANPSVKPLRACFGVAGPVEPTDAGGRSRITNLPWVVDAASLSTALGLRRARVINDFVAVAASIPGLHAEDLRTINEGVDDPLGHCAVLGAGTGLGEAILVRTGDHQEVVASEGGHTDFAARDEREVALWSFLRRRFGHVSYERVLSGHGLYACFEALTELRDRPVPAAVADRIAAEDPASVVSQLALAGDDPIAVEALDLFVSIYGAEAGNLALKVLATGGVYLAGGIAGRILPVLTSGAFLTSFCNKGRFTPFMERVPVHVIVNSEAGLLGAGLGALRL
jgi:glucokinase